MEQDFGRPGAGGMAGVGNMGRGEATSAAPRPPRVQKGEGGNEGLWGHMELPTPPKAEPSGNAA